MKKLVLVSAVAAALAAPIAVMAQTAPAAAPASPHTFTGNVGLSTDYLFRGISQTHGRPAISGGLDYSHSSGFYLGLWGSSISWVSDAQNLSVPTEIDVYGGFKNSFGSSDWTYDIGYIAYNYPGSKDTPLNNSAAANTQEVYGAIGWKWLTAKYSYTTSSNFVGWYGGPTGTSSGAPGTSRVNTNGSDYLELNGVYDFGSGWGVTGHVGQQKVRNYGKVGDTDASYVDWKVGVTKDIGVGVIGLAYSDTSSKGTCDGGSGGTNAYCWGVYSSGNNTSTGFRNASQGTTVLSFTKTF